MSNDRMTQRRLDREYDRQQAQFDALSPQDAADRLDLDPISERMAIASTSQMRLASLQVAFMLASILSESDYDDTEMLPSEVLDMLMLEAFSDDDDDDSDGGDIDENVKITFSAHVSDALSTLGVDDAVIDDLFDTDVEIADAAALVAAETVLENMPDDGDAFDEFVNAFAYSAEESGDASFDDMNDDDDDDDDDYQFDGARKKRKLAAGKKSVKKVNGKTLVYKAVKAIRNGKKVTVNKRISGKLKLSAKQKAGLKKARRKAGTSSAIRKRMRSARKGMRANIYKKK